MVRLSFIGDICLNDDYISLRKKGASPFQKLTSVFSASNLVIGNLECTLKGSQGENLLKKPRISTDSDTLLYLKDFNAGLVTMATNHVYDNLTDGFQRTAELLNSNAINYIGAGIHTESASRTFSFHLNDLSFCFFNYITEDTNPSLPVDSKLSVNIFNEQKSIDDLNKAVDYDFRIILLHWGGKFEGGLYPDYYQIALARKLIDNGADLIIGHHSHTLQPFDVYKGKYIFYSLGNFCFSDIRFEGKTRNMSSPRERESIILNADFTRAGYQVNWIPIRNEKLFLSPNKIAGACFIIRNACWKIIKIKVFWRLYSWWFRNVRPLLVQLARKDTNQSLRRRIVNYIIKGHKT